MACVKDKIIIVTGSTSGVGEACALDAAANGAAGVLITGRNSERGEAVRSRVEALGAEAIFVAAELADADQCRNIVAQCDAKWGRVDGLVNCAADTNRGTIEETTVEFWDNQMNVNVRAPFLLTQDSVKIMQREKIAGLHRQHSLRRRILRDGHPLFLQHNQRCPENSNQKTMPMHYDGIEYESMESIWVGRTRRQNTLFRPPREVRTIAEAGRASLAVWPFTQTQRCSEACDLFIKLRIRHSYRFVHRLLSTRHGRLPAGRRRRHPVNLFGLLKQFMVRISARLYVSQKIQNFLTCQRV